MEALDTLASTISDMIEVMSEAQELIAGYGTGNVVTPFDPSLPVSNNILDVLAATCQDAMATMSQAQELIAQNAGI